MWNTISEVGNETVSEETKREETKSKFSDYTNGMIT